ncbi:FecR family protein [Thermoflavifilum thermophilum]|uniref:FecR family protein n=1 Tax=Thermoflavifilum thermophilum TaxID=1393122 RepID=A0A1I7MXA6_9BACT|nr:FecR family protein [Thermoflavifilum thermophilum]SFV27053.1 FecR family protein [Thermoflavifilum thermophilum]
MDESRLNELISRYLTKSATPEELQELNDWIRRHPLIQHEIELLDKYWRAENIRNVDLDQAYTRLQQKLNKTKKILHKHSSTRGIIHRFPIVWIRWAAVILIIISLAIGTYQIWNSHHHIGNQPPRNWELTYDQPGIKSKLILPDSTEVWLNGNTRIYYPLQFTGKTREVWLSGEAYFKVKHDPDRTFIIHTAKMNITVLGTEFNVKCYPDDPLYETSLINGAILVTLKDRPEDRIILKPKEKLVVMNDRVTVQKQEHAVGPTPPMPAEKTSSKLWVTEIHYFSPQDSTLMETAWIDGKLVFRDENFTDLARRFERWYGYHFQFKDDSVKQYHFTGIFEHETLEQALKALQMAEKFRFQIQDQDSSVIIY